VATFEIVEARFLHAIE